MKIIESYYIIGVLTQIRHAFRSLVVPADRNKPNPVKKEMSSEKEHD